MLASVRRDRCAVFILKRLFERGRIDVELPRKLLDRHALGKMLKQIIVHQAHGFGARPTALAFGAGDLHYPLDRRVHRKADSVVRNSVIDLLTLAVRGDQTAFAQNAEMMRHCGTRNSELFGKPHAALLAVAEYPKYFYPRAVAEHLEKLCGGIKILVINMRMKVSHIFLLFGNKIRLFGRIKQKMIDFYRYKQYNTFKTIKQVLNC